jgi:integrase
MCLVKPVPVGSPDATGKRRTEPRRFPTRAMSNTAMHRWWYRQLEHAGIVASGETHGERMHKARHTAGQRVLDATGDLKLVQKLLGHASIQTTGDIYVDYDMAQFADRLAEALGEDE